MRDILMEAMAERGNNTLPSGAADRGSHLTDADGAVLGEY
eukprot:gene18983-824_t